MLRGPAPHRSGGRTLAAERSAREQRTASSCPVPAAPRGGLAPRAAHGPRHHGPGPRFLPRHGPPRRGRARGGSNTAPLPRRPRRCRRRVPPKERRSRGPGTRRAKAGPHLICRRRARSGGDTIPLPPRRPARRSCRSRPGPAGRTDRERSRSRREGRTGRCRPAAPALPRPVTDPPAGQWETRSHAPRPISALRGRGSRCLRGGRPPGRLLWSLRGGAAARAQGRTRIRFSIPGRVEGQAGRGFGQPGPVGGVPAQGRG